MSFLYLFNMLYKKRDPSVLVFWGEDSLSNEMFFE